MSTESIEALTESLIDVVNQQQTCDAVVALCDVLALVMYNDRPHDNAFNANVAHDLVLAYLDRYSRQNEQPECAQESDEVVA